MNGEILFLLITYILCFVSMTIWVYVRLKRPFTLTDFQKFLKLQNSGRINMTDIVTGARLAGISEDKYEDIMWHYGDYKSGKRS